MKLLLLSNSANAGGKYLEHAEGIIKKFLGEKIKDLLFIPYAAVTISYDDYSEIVTNRFEELGYNIVSVHTAANIRKAVKQSQAIIVGGGNTFNLLKEIQKRNLTGIISRNVAKGKPYIGWSAGANMACPTIKTTNDMPVVEPFNMNAFGLVPFQINPHYTDVVPENFAGETRRMRIREFIEINRDVYVVGLKEGTMLYVERNKVKLLGDKSAVIFRYKKEPLELFSDDDFNFLLK